MLKNTKSVVIHVFLFSFFIGCGNGSIGSGQDCVGNECLSGQSDSGISNPQVDQGLNQGADSTPEEPLPSCQSDSDCVDPYVCHLQTGQCVPLSAKENGVCDIIENQDCPIGLECINGICLEPPKQCGSNDDCPTGYLCIAGVCTPDSGGSGGCVDNSQCPSNTVCVAGICAPEEACTAPHAPDRLAGTWTFNSTLKVRDGLEGLMAGILGLASTVQKIIDGDFKIKIFGISINLSSILAPMIDDHLSPWAKKLIKWLAEMDDAIDEWEIESTETLTQVGPNIYRGQSTWKVIRLEYQGAVVSFSPKDVPSIGELAVTTYGARDICGTMLIDRHKVKNKIGEIFRWGIEAVLLTLTCDECQGECPKTLEEMFDKMLDCKSLASDIASDFPSYESALESVCKSEKSSLINKVINELDNITAKLTTMSLSAKASIPDHARTLDDGRWYGVMGFTYGKGNFEGRFNAIKN